MMCDYNNFYNSLQKSNNPKSIIPVFNTHKSKSFGFDLSGPPPQKKVKPLKTNQKNVKNINPNNINNHNTKDIFAQVFDDLLIVCFVFDWCRGICVHSFKTKFMVFFLN